MADARLEQGVAGRPLAGERRSGDHAVLKPSDGGVLVAAIDGLGHGEDAADASAAAADVLAADTSHEPEMLIEACHRALAGTRGAVMTIAWFDLDAGRLTWAGVGNVEGRLVRAASGARVPTEGALTKGGVVGYNLPSVRVTATALEDGDVIVFATDGIDSGFARAIVAGGTAQAIADRILAGHGKRTDDALVVVLRYRSGG